MRTIEIIASILTGSFLLFGCGTNTKSGKNVVIKDIDGNEYSTVAIGTQVWMAENLKTTKYNDGKLIPNVEVDSVWRDLKTDAYSWYNNDLATNKASLGALYNWNTVNTGKLCPTGWHVPSDKEWRNLTAYLGGENMAGNDLKTTSGWNKEGNGTNSSGFSAIPSGYRSSKGSFNARGISGYWWSSTPNTVNAWYCVIFSKDGTAFKYYGLPESGFSVRCVKN